MVCAKQIFDLLPGIWRLRRETLTPLKNWQNAGAECIKANGYAAFTSTETDPNLLIYSEKVKIHSDNDDNSGMNGMEAKQKYKYRYDPIATTLTKYFFDDRLFYTLKIDGNARDNGETEARASNALVGCGEHLCIQDLYKANYSFANDHQFELKYVIEGPKKCYEIITQFEKCNPDEIAQLKIQIENGDIL